MKDYYCYFCDSILRADNSNIPEDLSYEVSNHCHIITEFICINPECNTTHIEEVDKNVYLIFFGPLPNKEGL